ncbi:hypothetical protein AgCh_029823 [Apium graveolens]
MGGFRFRKLNGFNNSMLNKQAWRLLNVENRLVTETMKVRYYPRTNFIDAKLGANPSFMWRSIIASQEALKQGCRRKIEDGAEDTWSGCFTRVSTGLAEECSKDPLTLALIIPMIDGYQLGRQPANTRLSSNKTVRRVRVRGGNVKWRTLRLIEAGLGEPEPFDGSCPSFLPPSAPDS